MSLLTWLHLIYRTGVLDRLKRGSKKTPHAAEAPSESSECDQFTSPALLANWVSRRMVEATRLEDNFQLLPDEEQRQAFGITYEQRERCIHEAPILLVAGVSQFIKQHRDDVFWVAFSHAMYPFLVRYLNQDSSATVTVPMVAQAVESYVSAIQEGDLTRFAHEYVQRVYGDSGQFTRITASGVSDRAVEYFNAVRADFESHFEHAIAEKPPEDETPSPTSGKSARTVKSPAATNKYSNARSMNFVGAVGLGVVGVMLFFNKLNEQPPGVLLLIIAMYVLLVAVPAGTALALSWNSSANLRRVMLRVNWGLIAMWGLNVVFAIFMFHGGKQLGMAVMSALMFVFPEWINIRALRAAMADSSWQEDSARYLSNHSPLPAREGLRLITWDPLAYLAALMTVGAYAALFIQTLTGSAFGDVSTTLYCVLLVSGGAGAYIWKRMRLNVWAGLGVGLIVAMLAIVVASNIQSDRRMKGKENQVTSQRHEEEDGAPAVSPQQDTAEAKSDWDAAVGSWLPSQLNEDYMRTLTKNQCVEKAAASAKTCESQQCLKNIGGITGDCVTWATGSMAEFCRKLNSAHVKDLCEAYELDARRCRVVELAQTVFCDGRYG